MLLVDLASYAQVRSLLEHKEGFWHADAGRASLTGTQPQKYLAVSFYDLSSRFVGDLARSYVSAHVPEVFAIS